MKFVQLKWYFKTYGKGGKKKKKSNNEMKKELNF